LVLFIYNARRQKRVVLEITKCVTTQLIKEIIFIVDYNKKKMLAISINVLGKVHAYVKTNSCYRSKNVLYMFAHYLDITCYVISK